MTFHAKPRGKKILALCLSALLIFSYSPGMLRAELQDIVDTKDSQEVFLYKGDLVSLRVHSLTRMSLGRAGIVDIVNADEGEILLIGQGVGETPLYIWDEYGKRVIMVRVFNEDMDLTVARTESLLAAAGIKGVELQKNHYEGKVVAVGSVVRDQEEQVKTLLGKDKNKFVNLVRESGALVQIDVQISELSTTLSSVLGFDWSSGEVDGIVLPYTETLPTTDGSFGDLFKIGDFNRTTAITSTVNALITEGKARVLSKPSILVKDGEAATFLVGGEIPIRSTTTSSAGNSVTENIDYSDYGVDVSVTPEIIDDKIDLDFEVTIRDIDAANAVGDDVAFTTRTATTKLRLNDGQTIVLAGLIKHNEGKTIKRVPFLSAIPIVGLLFREKSLSPNMDQEVVISITSRIVQRNLPGEAAGLEANTAEDALLAENDPFLQGEEELFMEEDEAVDEDAGAIEEKAGIAGSPDEDLVPVAARGLEDVSLLDDVTKVAISDYVKKVQEKISQAISFPYEAKQKGWDGTVVLSMNILSDGSLAQAKVQESSGQAVFDKDAVNTAQILAPFDDFPVELGMEEIEVTIPIVYSQDSILGGNGN